MEANIQQQEEETNQTHFLLLLIFDKRRELEGIKWPKTLFFSSHVFMGVCGCHVSQFKNNSR